MAMKQGVKWRRFDWWLLVAFLLGMIWLSVPSSLFLNQISMTITKDEQGQWFMTSIRETPLGEVDARWQGEMRVVGREDGFHCFGEGRSIYSQIDGNLSRYQIRSWATPCLDAGPPTSVTYSRQVMLLGLIPLRPARFSFVINPENAPVVPIGE